MAEKMQIWCGGIDNDRIDDDRQQYGWLGTSTIDDSVSVIQMPLSEKTNILSWHCP